jgi:hypothetical protein
MKRFSALSILITSAALMGCNQTEPVSQHTDHSDEATHAKPVGQVLKEFKISDETKVSFRNVDGIVTMSLEGHMDEQAANKALEDKLFHAATLEAAYRMMDPTGAVPQAILDYDKSTQVVETTAPVAPTADEAVGPVSVAPPAEVEGLAKTSNHAVPSSDAWWDWTADANWWKSSVVGYSCGWHAVQHYTNYYWADDWRQGWKGAGYLMAASHTYGADASAYKWVNGAWVLTNSTYLMPRHYIIWYSGDNTQQYRRYRVAGYGGSLARVHMGIRWDTQAPSNIDVICQS